MRIGSDDDADGGLAAGADGRKVHQKPPDCHEIVTDSRLFAGRNCFLCDLREGPSLRLVRTCERCFDGSAGPSTEQPRSEGESVPTKQGKRPAKRSARKVSCEDCFFHTNLLCALELDEPCSTFRPSEAQLRPPQQLRFVFRQERRSRAAWAFPSAQEQAALHA
jgi:hypothetical protein